LLLALACGSPQSAPTSPASHLVIVADGLRPDYVTPELMPRLHALAQRGTVFADHHSVFPTVTRVNASSFVTGAYPEAHGLMGNTVYVPEANATGALNTGQRSSLEAIAHAQGRLLTAPTLGELLTDAGRQMLAVSSGSSGSAYLLNHTGAIVHYDYVQPPDLAARAAELGPAPPAAIPDEARNAYAIDAYLRFGLAEPKPDVTFMWLHEPDGTAHAHGIGVPLARQALAGVDAGIGRIEDALRDRGLLDRTNILVTSDHGFSTHTAELALQALVAPFAKTMPDGEPDIVVAGGAIHVRTGPDDARIPAIVAALQKRPEVGAIFTRPPPAGGPEGTVAGTLSFEVARWNHPSRAGEILVSANWTRARNAEGIEGSTTQGGVAGHGTSSPYDVHNTLIAAGPDFRQATVSRVPTGNVDVAPTLLHLLGIPVPGTMAGRVIEEGLRNGPDPGSVAVERSTEIVATGDGGYELRAHLSSVAGRRYLDYTEVSRK
jgi:arylsulfatase A-like enzyme